MKSRFLFPHRWRITGLILFVVGAITFIITQHYWDNAGGWLSQHRLNFGMDPNVLINDVVYLSCIVGSMLIAFSKEKIEDEQIAQLRSDSLQWAIYFNYGILIVCTIFINGGGFLAVAAYSVITPLLFFIVRFRWVIFNLNRSLSREI